MTARQKNMGWTVAVLVTLGIFIVTVVYAAGGQSKEIRFNTERIRRVEHTMKERFDIVDNNIEKIMQEIKR